MNVPISIERYVSSPIGQKISEAYKPREVPYSNYRIVSTHANQKSIFVANILEELEYKRSDRKLYWWIQSLPKTARNFPTLFSKEEKRMLKGSALLRLIEFQIFDWKTDYEDICQALPNFRDSVSFDDYQYWRLMVQSRNFGFKKHDGRQEVVHQYIFPYIDLINHNTKPNVKWVILQHELKLIALEEIAESDEVFLDYGFTESNSQFFIDYGFLSENSENDTVCFFLNPYYFKDQQLFNNKMDWLNSNKFLNGLYVFQFSTNWDLDVVKSGFGYLRFMAIDKNEDLVKFVEKFYGVWKFVEPISIYSDTKMLH